MGLAEVALHGRALAPDEIRRLYAVPTPSECVEP
jgi:hypothetical protein